MKSFFEYLTLATKTVIISSYSAVYSLSKIIFNPNEKDVNKELYKFQKNSKNDFDGIDDYFNRVRRAMFEVGVLPEGLEESLTKK
jgi:hypothetical protein